MELVEDDVKPHEKEVEEVVDKVSYNSILVLCSGLNGSELPKMGLE